MKFCKKNGETGTILTNLAKVYYEMGENDRGFSTLERGLNQDPNQENGFTWYLSIIKEKFGESTVNDRIEEFAKLENAWRPQLMYGAYHIRSGNKQEGLEIFTRIIDKGIINEESLQIITGVLGEASMFEEALELTESIYRINNHGVPAGYNLLRIYESTQRYQSAIHLIDEMLQSGRVDIYQPLREYREKLERLLKK
ncbi:MULTISPECIES: lipopolysaccharide assembly protein LapB [unclassified Fusibacter]|uniref:tetratricopeptide repeat protein n=2 Tax=Fusibacter TaxID=76008 RepID=UPI001024C644|nr:MULTISPECIES: hypothetical protein [unclassified Fusibacter]RXV63770.1 hypothetical protein DWB64_01980 [Fusibacter sp. A1]